MPNRPRLPLGGRTVVVTGAAKGIGATAGVAYFGFVDTDLVGDAFARPQVDTFRRALPAFLTRPIPVDDAARALVDGIEARAPRVTAPAWVRPALALRGLTDPLADRWITGRAAAAVRQAESPDRTPP